MGDALTAGSRPQSTNERLVPSPEANHYNHTDPNADAEYLLQARRRGGACGGRERGV